jgi:hypothetical protein
LNGWSVGFPDLDPDKSGGLVTIARRRPIYTAWQVAYLNPIDAERHE